MKYGFIGCGNMGGAIATALSKATKDMMVSDRSGKAAALAEKLGIGYGTSEQIAQSCDIIFLGVKPHMMRDCLLPLQTALQERKPMLVTMVAGLEIRKIEEFAGCRLPVIRIMPNTPAAVGSGVILYDTTENVSQEALAQFLTNMAKCGWLDPLPEKLIDAGSAVSGCGPAFVCLFLEALADGGVLCGLPRDKALAYAARTLEGTAKLLLETGDHPGKLKDAVCSPGGSTIVGVKALEAGGLRSAAIHAVEAAYVKTKELGK